MYAADKIGSKTVENWLLQKPHIFVSVIEDRKDDLYEVAFVEKIVSYCF